MIILSYLLFCRIAYYYYYCMHVVVYNKDVEVGERKEVPEKQQQKGKEESAS